MPERARNRWRPANFTPPATPLRVTNALGTDGGAASIYLYDAIDEWGGEFGVSCAEFVAALNGIQASRLELHINSPGGDFFQAIGMRAALAAHPASVFVYIDGLAASAASVLATVGDRVIAARGSQVMIHKASSLAIGNSEDMRAQADLLDKVDRDIAQFYLDRSGQGDLDSWLEAMSVETWMTADEAVAAGLVDEVAADPARNRDDGVAVAAAANRWVLAAWRYAGRDEAPAPTPVTATTDDPVEPVEQPEPVAVEDTPPVEPTPLTAPLLDDDAVARIAEAVAERLAQRTPESPAPEAEAPVPPETSAVETADAPTPAALPMAGSPTPGPYAAWDPHLFRQSIRKAAAS